jgi:hypothetical protein
MRKITSFVFNPFRKTAQWIVLIWNIFSGCFYYELFHFPLISAFIFQVIAFAIEYAVSAYYQKQFLYYDNRIVLYSKKKNIPWLLSYLMRYISFLVIYWGIFMSTFFVRLWLISLPSVVTWIKKSTFWLFGEAAQMDLFTRDLHKTIIVACLSSLLLALTVPLSVLAKRALLRKLSKWKFRGKLSKKQHYRKHGKH